MTQMAGKASLLLAAMFFGMGAVGLALTAGETASWGPFDAPHVSVARQPVPTEGPVLSAVAIPVPALRELAPEVPVSTEAMAEERNAVADYVETPAQAASPTVPPTPTPEPRPPLLVHGVASDGGSAGAAGVTALPVIIGMVTRDAEETPAPESANAGDAVPEPSATPSPAAAPPTATETPAPDATPEASAGPGPSPAAE